MESVKVNLPHIFVNEGNNMRKNKNTKKVVPSSKDMTPISDKQKRLQEAIKKSPFAFGDSKHPFVPVYGPFAWVPEPDRCTMHASGGVSLEGF